MVARKHFGKCVRTAREQRAPGREGDSLDLRVEMEEGQGNLARERSYNAGPCCYSVGSGLSAFST